jgi:hypothetical protein
MLPFSALNPSPDASKWHNIRKLKKKNLIPIVAIFVSFLYNFYNQKYIKRCFYHN